MELSRVMAEVFDDSRAGFNFIFHVLADQEFDAVRIIVADDFFHQADLIVFTAQAQDQDGTGAILQPTLSIFCVWTWSSPNCEHPWG